MNAKNEELHVSYQSRYHHMHRIREFFYFYFCESIFDAVSVAEKNAKSAQSCKSPC